MRAPLLALAGCLVFASVAGGTELDDYVAIEDGALAYPVHDEFEVLGARVVNVRLTSQNWRGHEWQHWLTVIVPPKVDPHGRGVLIVDGGSSSSKVPAEGSQKIFMVATSALQLRAPIAVLGQVPNQPMFDGLYEDDLIAHTFDKFLEGGDSDWPALLPMTKSATRAMDALSALAKGGKINLPGGEPLSWDKFIVSGASKRGWTTYLTAAVDKRVVAMAPMVIDVLNMREQMELQLKSYGKFSDMIRPYTQRKVPQRSGSPVGLKLNSIVDPFAYNGRYTMPKLVMLGTNDPYWSVDSSSLYFDELPQPRSLYYMPNAGHGLGLIALKTGNAFFASQLDSKPFPEIGHVHSDKTGAWTVSWKPEAKGVELWTATSKDRDFRDATWNPQPLEISELLLVGGRVTRRHAAEAKLAPPTEGYSAHFIRVTFPGLREGMGEFHLATPIKVLPETFPHALPSE